MDVCKNCGGSGRNPGSQHLDCRECGAAQERTMVEQYWGSLPASMDLMDAIWAVYQFRRTPAPAALTPEKIREIAWEFQAGGDTGKWIFLDGDLPAFAQRLATASAAPAEQAGDAEWISVADRLPEPWTEVMVWPHPSDYCMTAELRSDGIWQYGEYVHHHGHENVKMPDARIEYWAPLLAAPDASQQKGSHEKL